MLIEYRRARKDETLTSRRTAWESKCDRYRIERHDCKFSDRVRFLTMGRAPGGWRLLVMAKAYRTRAAAERAVRKYERARAENVRRSA